MITRRSFLASSSLLAASGAALCRPPLTFADASPVLQPQPGASADAVQAAFLAARKDLLGRKDPKIFLGYPGNMNIPDAGFFQWRDEVHRLELGERSNNNVGDPFRDRGAGASHMLEADLIERFAGRYGMARDGVWGFVSNSGTDSNMHGAYVGRTLLARRTGRQPVIYYTREAHYSIQIIRDVLGLEEVLVAANPDGSFNIADFRDRLAAHRDQPALVLATVGTTFKGGIDDLDAIRGALGNHPSFVHLDAALFGGYLHTTDDLEHFTQHGPAGRRYDSLAISCHKFFGFPRVAGMFMMGRPDFEEFRGYFSDVHNPAYISHVPGTITCSRDPSAAAEFHYYSTQAGLTRQARDAKLVLGNAAYLLEEMQRHYPQLNAQRANERSNIVYFNNTLAPQVLKKWYLATVTAAAGDSAMAHVVVMPHAEKALLDQFLEDLATKA